MRAVYLSQVNQRIQQSLLQSEVLASQPNVCQCRTKRGCGPPDPRSRATLPCLTPVPRSRWEKTSRSVVQVTRHPVDVRIPGLGSVRFKRARFRKLKRLRRWIASCSWVGPTTMRRKNFTACSHMSVSLSTFVCVGIYVDKRMRHDKPRCDERLLPWC